jgi:hypothetical protein
MIALVFWRHECLFKDQSTGFLNLARERVGCNFLSKAEFAAGSVERPRGKVQEYRLRHVPALWPHWSGRGTANEASGLALVIHRSKTGSGDVVADRRARRIAW